MAVQGARDRWSGLSGRQKGGVGCLTIVAVLFLCFAAIPSSEAPDEPEQDAAPNTLLDLPDEPTEAEPEDSDEPTDEPTAEPPTATEEPPTATEPAPSDTPEPTATDEPTIAPTATVPPTIAPTIAPTQPPPPTEPPPPTPEPGPPNDADPGANVNCSHFATRREAQAWWDYWRARGIDNPGRLDGNDQDGLVCESKR